MNISIAQRLWILVGGALFALIAVGGIGGYVAHTAQRSLENVHTRTLPAIETLSAVERNFFLVRVNAYAHIIADSDERKSSLEKNIVAAQTAVTELINGYEKQLTEEADRKLLAQDRSALSAYMTVLGEVLDASRKNDTAAAREIVANRWKPAGDGVTSNLKAHTEYHKQLAHAEQARAAEESREGQWLSWGIIVAGALAVSTLGMLLVRKIVGEINTVQNSVMRIERDLDFTVRTPVHGRDELGVMATAFNRLIERLQNNLREIHQSAGAVAGSAGTLASNSRAVATASEQQSSAAASMAASIEEMTVSITHVGDRAGEASALASESGQQASDGRSVIEQTVGDINEIAVVVHTASGHLDRLGEQGEQISSVVQVIKEVADQTNLLALNAAIEAARAGEQGRGFAVVADEVRKLAERTAASTQQISQTIEGMREATSAASQQMSAAVQRVETGVTRAGSARSAISQIEEGSQRTVQTVGEIAEAMREQSSASTSVAQNVERIAQMAEAGAGAAQNSAHSAHELDRLAQAMHTVVAAYRL